MERNENKAVKSFASSTLTRIGRRLHVSNWFIAASVLDFDQIDSPILSNILIEKGLSAVELLEQIEDSLGFSNTSRLIATPTLPLPQLTSFSQTTLIPANDSTEQMVSLVRS